MRYERPIYHNQHSNNRQTWTALVIAGLVLAALCWALYTGNFDPMACNGTQVQGWSGGRYTSLCIENHP